VAVAAVVLGEGAVLVADADRPAAKKSLDEVVALMASAKTKGRLRSARKTRPVDARPAKAGEVIVTVIKGEGKETQSRPAAVGDWVVRNRCPETGNEEYLVSKDKFAGKYEATGAPASPGGWEEFHPVGDEVRVLILEPKDGAFSFTAPWGEEMVARTGDAMVQSPKDEKDVYRVARASFECTYEWLP
jgi:hypothetical protein